MKRFATNARVLAALLAAVAAGGGRMQAASFQLVAQFDPPIEEVWVSNVSADGSTLVGSRQLGDHPPQMWCWKASVGEIRLAPVGEDYGHASAASADGSVVVGMHETLGQEPRQAFRWSSADGIVHLAPGSADGVSADGSVVAGATPAQSGWGNEAFRWEAESGLERLGFLPGDDGSAALAVSADGLTVVGVSGTLHFGNQAFCWTSDGNMVGLGHLPGGDYSMAYAVSADGSTVVGYSESQLGQEAFRWTAGEGMVGLGFLPGHRAGSLAFDVSGDGSLIVGESIFSWNAGAFLWDEVNEMQNLGQWLTDNLGLDLDGWTLAAATGISDDGKVIVGSATHPSGLGGCWRAVIPEPSALALLSVGVIAFLCAWRGRPTCRSSDG